MIADWLTATGLGGLKPVLSALVLPPVPFLVVALAGASLTRKRPRTARTLVILACVATWLCACTGFSQWLEAQGLHEPAPLASTERTALKARAAAGEPLAIVVLGGGVDQPARSEEHTSELQSLV